MATDPIGALDTRMHLCQFSTALASRDAPTDSSVICGQPAVWHMRFTDDGENGMACDAHAAGAYVLARHERGFACGVPGSYWTDEGCFHPLDEETPEAMVAAEMEATRA